MRFKKILKESVSDVWNLIVKDAAKIRKEKIPFCKILKGSEIPDYANKTDSSNMPIDAGKYYELDGSCISLPSWADTKDFKKCFQSYGSFATVQVNGNDVIGVSEDGQQKITFHADNTFDYHDELSTPKNDTGKWRCDANGIVMALCGTKYVFFHAGNWKKNTVRAEALGCPAVVTPSNQTVTDISTSYTENCVILKKQCKSPKIFQLKKCLNIDNPDDKWDSKLDDEIGKVNLKFIQGMSNSDVDKLCCSRGFDMFCEPEYLSPEDEIPIFRTIGESKKSRIIKEATTLTQDDLLKLIPYLGCNQDLTLIQINRDGSTTGQNQITEKTPNFTNTSLVSHKIGNDTRRALRVQTSSSTQGNSLYYWYFIDGSGIKKEIDATNKIIATWYFSWKCPNLAMISYLENFDILRKFGINVASKPRLIRQVITNKINNLKNLLNIWSGLKSDDLYELDNLLKTEKYLKDWGLFIFSTDKTPESYMIPDDTRGYKQVPAKNLKEYGMTDQVYMIVPDNTVLDVEKVGEENDNTTACKTNLITYLKYATEDLNKLNPRFINRYTVGESVKRCFMDGGINKNTTVSFNELKPKGEISLFDYVSGDTLDYTFIKNFLTGNGPHVKNVADKSQDAQLTFRQQMQRLGKGLRDAVDIIANPKKKVAATPDYILNLDSVKENFEGVLRSKILGTLNETILEKKKILTEERIVKNRVELLFEDMSFETRENRANFVINLLKETLTIEAQGFSKRVINEEFWDVLKGFFGEKDSDKIFQSFKIQMSKWLINHLSPKKQDGWIASCISEAIRGIQKRDVHMITDCKFLTREITDCIIDKLHGKVTKSQLRDKGLYDIIGKGMTDNVNSVRFRQHVEKEISSMICPVLYNMSNRFDSTFEKMKKRAIGLD